MPPLPVVLDRRSAVPLYYQIHQHLLGQIQAGTLKPGELIPSEQEISSKLGVSRMTARQAVKSLCDAGVAYSRRGLGTFVSAAKQEKTSSELLSFTQEMTSRGSRPGSRVIAFDKIFAENEVAIALHLRTGEKVIRLVRVRLADSRAMGVETSYLPAGLVPDLISQFDARTSSLYETLAKLYGMRMAVADEVVEVGLADADAVELLRIRKGSPVFLLTRISYMENGRPVEYVRSVYRGDRWKIVSRLTANHTMHGEAKLQPRSSPILSATLVEGDVPLSSPEHTMPDRNDRRSMHKVPGGDAQHSILRRRTRSGPALSDSTSEEKS
jgi:GntR family transcriptional regulator